MKTQVSILVKNESLASRTFSFFWFINIFKKMSVDVIIDDPNAQPRRLKASKEPYLIDLEPGQHTIAFADPRAGSKHTFKAITGAFVGASLLGGAGGGSFMEGASWGADLFTEGTVRNGMVQFTLGEGDVLKLSAKPKHNGSVKVKILKK